VSKETSATDTLGAYCPSCERFIGPVATCPYCDADANDNVLLLRLRYAAVLLGTIGLFFLYLMVAHRGTPLVRIGSITPMMNFARVRVAGTVTGKPYIKPQNGQAGYVSFVVNDGTGNLRVKAYKDVAQALCDQELVPRPGTIIEVEGQLRVDADKKAALFLNSTETLHIQRQQTSR